MGGNRYPWADVGCLALTLCVGRRSGVLGADIGMSGAAGVPGADEGCRTLILALFSDRAAEAVQQ